eukprot:2561421-Ditylum_brightwellii.AAC.1
MDIGYASAELSKFSSKTAKCHYKAIKRVYRYLCQTRDWGSYSGYLNHKKNCQWGATKGELYLK